MSEPHDTAYDYDVIVVGAGGAGLAASVSAAEAGARVLLLEAEDEIGGSTQLSAGLLTASATSVQESLGVDDSPLRMFQHYMDLNGWRVRPGPVRMFCEQSSGTVEWLLGLGSRYPPRSPAAPTNPG